LFHFFSKLQIKEVIALIFLKLNQTMIQEDNTLFAVVNNYNYASRADARPYGMKLGGIIPSKFGYKIMCKGILGQQRADMGSGP
jgi:hypothetical protein